MESIYHEGNEDGSYRNQICYTLARRPRVVGIRNQSSRGKEGIE